MLPDIFPNKAHFRDAYKRGKPQLVYSRIINDIDTPVSAFLKIAANKPYAFLFESVSGGEVRGRYSFVGFSPDIVLQCHGDDAQIARSEADIASKSFTPLKQKPLEALRTLQSECAFSLPDGIPPMASGLFGYMGYDTVRQVESLPGGNPDPIGTPDTIMVRPTVIAIFDLIAQEIILTTTAWHDDKQDADTAFAAATQRLETVVTELECALPTFIAKTTRTETLHPNMGTTQNEFSERVKTAKNYIKAGDVFQVVIGQRFEAPLSTSSFSLYRSLRRMNPSPFLYYLNFDDHAVVGSSPEILVRVRDDVVTVRPIAGTRPRGRTPQEDLALESELLADQKECAEHLMLLDLGRNDVGRVAKPGTVRVTESYTIERYSHVMHIVSNVEGTLDPKHDAISALMAGFPAGTVSGAPKVRAMEIIDELENEKRGIYAGAVGYISCEGQMDTAIALRTAIVKNGVMHVRAGAGIVLDSDPISEFNETQHKARALFKAAEGATQFERN